MEGSRQIEITVAPHVVRALEDEAQTLDTTPGDLIEAMVRDWEHKRSWRRNRIRQVELERKMAADAEGTGETTVGGGLCGPG